MFFSPSLNRRMNRSAAIAGTSLFAALLWLVAVAGVAQASVTQTYTYSPNYQYFTVPSGVSSLHVDVTGGSGANGQGAFGGGAGGPGGEVVGDLAVVPGEQLTLWVGGAGQSDGSPGYGSPSHSDFEGGYGGAGFETDLGAGNGGGGGAASSIMGGQDVFVVAGGGGGGGGSGTYVPSVSSAGGGGSPGGYTTSGALPGSDRYATTTLGGNGIGIPSALAGEPNATGSDDGGDGGVTGSVGGGGGGGGGGLAVCDATYPSYCFSAGGGGQAGSNSFGGAGGAGGDSYVAEPVSNVSYGQSSFGAGQAGQITISYRTPSTTTVDASTATSDQGQSVTFRAFVDGIDGGGVVSFTDSGSAIAGCTNTPFISGGGGEWEAVCTTSSLQPGNHLITAMYSGDQTYADSSARVSEIVRAATTTSLSAPRTVAPNTTVKLTATVHSADAGVVAFTQAGAPLAGCDAVPLVYTSKAWRAVCTAAWPQTGTYKIVANYSGDDYSEPSSAGATVTVKPVPVVSSVSPSAGPTAGGETVTITGTNFTGATSVSFGNVEATNVTVLSNSALTATVPGHAPGTVPVIVTSPVGKSAVTSGAHFTYDAVPTVSAISPSNGAKGSVVTLTGSGLVTGTKVMFGSTPAVKVVRVSSTELKATAPAGTGSVGVTATNPGGTSAATSADQFTYSS